MVQLLFYKNTKKRAVAPVVSTILLVAIAVVGGTIIFTFSEGFFSSAQISGYPKIEPMGIIGFDATDGSELVAHDGIITLPGSSGNANNIKSIGERIIIYFKNNSHEKISINELRFGGMIYNFDTSVTNLDTSAASTAPTVGGYVILNDPSNNGLLNSNSAIVHPGETTSIVLGLSQNIHVGRDAQFKLTTNNGNMIVSTITIGTRIG